MTRHDWTGLGLWIAGTLIVVAVWAILRGGF